MEKYTGINYEKNKNCFEDTKHITSTLLYGDTDNIKEPLFTVLIPTYSRTELLKYALKSVLDQWHTPFLWDVIVLDNEAYDGKTNETEKLIRKTDNPRVLYYRNSEHMRPGDNFNRGIYLARGKWVMMLHDDDLLLPNSLQNMGKLVSVLENISKKPLGAVSVKYHQFTYDKEHPGDCWPGIMAAQNYYCSLPTNYAVWPLSHWNVLFTGHIGGDVPSNGATYLREAVLKTGGFNDDFGISADLILYYCLENKYSVYSTLVPYGFYRWGSNTMSRSDSTYKTVKNGYDFREYVYSKNIFTRLWGHIFRTSQHRRYTVEIIQQKKASVKTDISIESFNDICGKQPGPHLYAFYVYFVHGIYEYIYGRKVTKIYKKSMKYLRDQG